MSSNAIFRKNVTRTSSTRSGVLPPGVASVREACICWCITLAAAFGVPATAQQVTAKEPPADTSPAATPQSRDLPQDPGAERFPTAIPVPEPSAKKITIDSDRQSRNGNLLLLDGNVVVTYGDYRLEADHIRYDQATGDAEAEGHVHITADGGKETMQATRALLNIHTENGRMYNVSGSIGVKLSTRGTTYTTENPFLFTGREVIRTGPQQMEIIDGTVTSCQLPHPDWQLAAGHFLVQDGKARAKNTIFRLYNIPVFFLPYATHPTDSEERQSGFMIPIIGNSTTKGIVIGEQFYMTLGRSADLTVGAEYFSRRGWEQSASFRMQGRNNDFLKARYSGLLDRGFYQATTTTTNGKTTTMNTYVNQGGEDVAFSGRKDFSLHTRAAADAEYLSSYIYREAFTDNFNQAVSSDIKSYLYGTTARNGYVAALEMERYQGLKIVSTGEQIRIFHAPVLDLDSLERRIGTTPFLWSSTLQYAGLKRTQGTPSAQTGFASDLVSRYDVHPQLAMPFGFAGFRFRPSVGLHDTYYSHSRAATALPGPVPTERAPGLNRFVTEAGMEMRFPVLERTFDTGAFRKILGREARHTIEPEMNYRYASGVSDFARTLRFDDTDVVANRNELEYGFTQRLFLRPTKTRACYANEDPAETNSSCGGTRETIRWKLVQRHYFDDTFGGYLTSTHPDGVLVLNRRNVLDSTLDLSGIAFLTDFRSASPLVSEMKLSATDHIDMEWDMAYDLHAGRMRQSNVFVDYHQGNFFGGFSHARLYAPGRFTTDTGSGSTATSLISDFSQLRVLLGYGTPSKPGLSIAANAGIDLKLSQVQYAASQVSYNWNCCGISGEYRKYELGSVRNENAYRFNFTLANIGTAGNLRRAERLF